MREDHRQAVERVAQLVGEAPAHAPKAPPSRAVFTSGVALTPDLRRALERLGFCEFGVEPAPFQPAANAAG